MSSRSAGADRARAADRPVHLLRPPRPAAAPRGEQSGTSELKPQIARVHAAQLRRLRRPEGVAAAEPGRHRGRPVHGGTADAPSSGCAARSGQGQAHHDRGPGRRACPQDLVQRATSRRGAGPAVGGRPDLRVDLVRLGLRRLRRGRLRPPNPGLAHRHHDDHRARAGRVEQASGPGRDGRPTDRAGPPHDRGRNTRRASASARRSRHPALRRRRRATLRQRAGRDDQRALQDRADQAAGTVANRRRKSSWPPPNGSTGTTTAASTSTAATSHPPNWRPLTTIKQSPANRWLSNQ